MMMHIDAKNVHDDSLEALVDKRLLAAKSHYPLEQIRILKDSLQAFDEDISKTRYKYSVILGYCGLYNGHSAVMLGIRREDKRRLLELIRTYQIEQ